MSSYPFAECSSVLFSRASIRNTVLALAGLFYGSSLMLTGFYTSGEDIRGIWLLLTGWLGVLVVQFAWFANPVMLLSLLLLERRPFVAVFLAIVALTLATQMFQFFEFPTLGGEGNIYIREFGLGAYLWYGALWLLLSAVLLNLPLRFRRFSNR